jgi:hypothetical protein
MTVTIQIEGMGQVQAALRKFGKAAADAIGKDVTAVAFDINLAVKKEIRKKGKGITYHRIAGDDGLMRVYAGSYSENGPNKLVALFKTGGKANLSPTHTASAAGDAPATDTGGLISSLYFKQDTKMSATIGSRLAYAYYLEYGVTRIAPRPVWQPETIKGQTKLNERVIKTLERLAK